VTDRGYNLARLIDILAGGIIDDSGNPLDSGKVYVYEIGTTTPVTTYQDIDLTTPNTNPIILDAAGRAEVYVENNVRLVIEDQDSNTIQDIDALGSTLSGTTVVSDLEVEGEVDSDLIPKVDSTYDVGSTTKRWETGYFDTINATNIQGTLSAVGALTPGWVNNLRISYAAGVFTISGANGQDLSETNPGYIGYQAITSTNTGILKVTSNFTFQDDAHASSHLTNFGFGLTESVSWLNDVPFFLYAIIVINASGVTDANGVDGNSTLAISRLPWLKQTPASDATLIGTKSGVASTDNEGSMLIMATATAATYTAKPVQIFGCFRMQWSTVTDDWTVSSMDFKLDGVGQTSIDRMLAQNWIFPVGQNGADAGLYMISGADVAPAFTTQIYEYNLTRYGDIAISVYFTGDGGTDGTGATRTNIVTPILGKNFDTSATECMLGMALILASATATDPYFAVMNSASNLIEFYSVTGTNSTLSDFGNGTRQLTLRTTYRGKLQY